MASKRDNIDMELNKITSPNDFFSYDMESKFTPSKLSGVVKINHNKKYSTSQGSQSSKSTNNDNVVVSNPKVELKPNVGMDITRLSSDDVNLNNCVAWGMRLAPRQVSTVGRAIKSFREVIGDDLIYIFSEPGGYVKTEFEGITNVRVIENSKRLGDVGNYKNALDYLYRNTDNPYICVLEDDFLFHPDSKNAIYSQIAKLKNMFGYLSLRSDLCSGFYINKEGWNDVSVNGGQRVGRGLTGNVFLYPREVVGDILSHPYFINHCNTYKKQNASDCQLAETIKLLGYKPLYHNPSLLHHIGDHSTLGHTDANKRVDGNLTFFHKECKGDSVVLGLASIPERERFLKRVIASVYDQVDEINVGLNNYDHIPSFLLNDKKIRPYILDNSRGDAAKFYNVHEVQGYYFSIDDDLLYPSDYVSEMIKWINYLGKDRVAVGSHGHFFKKTRGIIDPERDVDHYYYYTELASNYPVPVHILGTGAAAFHTSALQLHYQDFIFPNKGDEQLSVFAKVQGVDMYVIPHKQKWIQNLDSKLDTPALRKETTWNDRIDWYRQYLFQHINKGK